MTSTLDALFGAPHATDPPGPHVADTDREPLFEEDAEIDLPVALTVPARFPTKHEMMVARPRIIEHLVGQHGALKTFLLIKFVEKLLLDKDQGVARQIKDAAECEYLEKYGTGSQEIMGVKITPRSANALWIYPPEVAAMETQLDELKRRVAAARKAAEIEGTAMKYKTDDKTISVTFL